MHRAQARMPTRWLPEPYPTEKCMQVKKCQHLPGNFITLEKAVHKKMLTLRICLNCYENLFVSYYEPMGYKVSDHGKSIPGTILHKEIIRSGLAGFCHQNTQDMNTLNTSRFSDSKEHRLEFVTAIDGIQFINDSRSTNPNMTWFALQSMHRPVILIMGGVNKGHDLNALNEAVSEKVIALVCLGENNKTLKRHFAGKVKLTAADNMAEAVQQARSMAKRGDVILLSPAHPSFDMFKDLEDRGRQFKNIVKSI